MKTFKKYLEYLKDNPKEYWFARKIYGWGWTPANWKGWLTTLIYAILVIALVLIIDENSTTKEMFFVTLMIVILTFNLIHICYKKGPKPKWQWGFPEDQENTKTE